MTGRSVAYCLGARKLSIALDILAQRAGRGIRIRMVLDAFVLKRAASRRTITYAELVGGRRPEGSWMTKSIYLTQDEICQILDLSVESDKPLSDKIIGKLGKALGFDADKMIRRHQDIRQETLSSGRPVMDAHRLGWDLY
jgi:hypothetical protein